MDNFILNAVLWTLALYGLFTIVKNILYILTYTNLKSDGIYMIIAVKNQENRVEGFLRSMLFRFLYGAEDTVKDIIVADLDSTDETPKILEQLGKDYECVKITNWKECKELLDNVNEIK